MSFVFYIYSALPFGSEWQSVGAVAAADLAAGAPTVRAASPRHALATQGTLSLVQCNGALALCG